MKNMKNQSGDITKLSIWCDDCQVAHDIAVNELFTLAAKFPKHPLIAKIGGDLVATSMAMAFAAGLISVDEITKMVNPNIASGLVRSYSEDEMNDFTRRTGHLFGDIINT